MAREVENSLDELGIPELEDFLEGFGVGCGAQECALPSHIHEVFGL